MEKDDKIQAEIKRLTGIYRASGKNEKAVIDGLIKRAAFMRVTLEDMEGDLNTKGFVEMFSQSERAEPYERERPVARLYNTINKNYQGIMKQLSDFVQKTPPKPESDGFEDFVKHK